MFCGLCFQEDQSLNSLVEGQCPKCGCNETDWPRVLHPKVILTDVEITVFLRMEKILRSLTVMIDATELQAKIEELRQHFKRL